MSAYRNRAHLLLIDHDPASVRQLSEPLGKRGYHVLRVESAREGLGKIYHYPPDLILLGRDLSDMDGLHLCAEMKNDIVLRHIPIVLLDGESLLDGEITAREAGAEDYLSKPVDIEELDGRIHQILQQGTLGVNCNPVTGLPGYETVYRKIQEIVDKERPYAVCFLDINQFRQFNRQCGYLKGDDLLRTTARRIAEVLHAEDRYLDFFGHAGADDFMLITEPGCAEHLCTRIVASFEELMCELYTTTGRGSAARLEGTGAGGRVFLSIAIITHETGRPGHVARLVEQGAELLTLAKRQGRSHWVKERRRLRGPPEGEAAGSLTSQGGRAVAGPDPARGFAKRVQTFREILHDKAVSVVFQPIVLLESGDLFGYEALLRGPRATYFESPITLFGIARRLDMELALDLICLKHVQGVVPQIGEGLKVFCNVSPSSFLNPVFREACRDAAEKMKPERIVLEVTRKRRIREYPRFRESSRFYRQTGFGLAVDDARAGTLSLRTVLELVPDYIKTDISVTRDIHRSPAKQRVFRQYQAFCNRQRLCLIPEGVESEQERDYLLAQGARLAQGFLFAPPRPLNT